MASPQGVPGGFDRRTLNKRLLLGYAAIVALIFVGLYQFDQIVASIYAYAYGSFPVIEGTSLEFNRWSVAVLNIVLVGLFLALVPLRVKGSWKTHGTYMGFMVSLFAEMYGFPLAGARPPLLPASEARRGHACGDLRTTVPRVGEQEPDVPAEAPPAARLEAGVALSSRR